MQVSLEKLKTYFETGDRPTQQEIWNLLESIYHKEQGHLVKSISKNAKGDIVVNYSDGGNYVISKTDNKKSITRVDGNLELLNDQETPRKDSFYGVDSAGKKGYHRAIEILDFHSYVNNRLMRESFGRRRVAHTTYFEKEFDFLREGKYAIILSTKISMAEAYYYTSSNIFEGRLHFNNVVQDSYQEKLESSYVYRGASEDKYSRTLMGFVNAKKGVNKIKFDFKGQAYWFRASVHGAKLLIYKVSE